MRRRRNDSGTCPYCNIALRTYQPQLVPALAERRISRIAISPQTADGSASTRESKELTFTVLSDPGNQIARQLGILTAAGPECDLDGTQNAAHYSSCQDERRLPGPSREWQVVVIPGSGGPREPCRFPGRWLYPILGGPGWAVPRRSPVSTAGAQPRPVPGPSRSVR